MFLNLHTAIYSVADVDKLAENKKVDSSLDLNNEELYVDVGSDPREDNSQKQGLKETPFDEEDPCDDLSAIDEEEIYEKFTF